MDTQPLVVEASARVIDFLKTALSDRPSDLVRGFIVTTKGAYFGVGTPLVLLKAASDANAAAAAEMTELARNLTIANTKAERQRQFTETVIDNMPAMVTVRDRRGIYSVLNRAGEELMGRPREQVLGRQMSEFYSEAEVLRVLSEDQDVLSSGQVKRVEREEVVLPTGERRVLRSRKLALPGSEGRPRYLLVVSEDVTGEVEAEARIARLAHYDALTDLPNRVLFRQSLEAALARVRRGGETLATLVIDLDRFKAVNDTLGHPIGDALLKAVTVRMQACIRLEDTLARLGGDEFAIVQTGLETPDAAGRLAQRIVAALAEPFDVLGHQVIIGASVGVALAPTDSLEADDLLKMADLAAYRVKAEGRGGFHYFERGMDERLRARRDLELDLRRALPAGEFELYYQPLLNLADSRVVGCEALMRWNHPTRGLVPPGEFIDLSEEIGLIVPLGEWAIRQACADAWPEPLKVAVNISPAQFRNRCLIEVVTQALANSGLAPERLELEITETVLLHDSAGNLELLHRLRALGVRISMDDFGTGYSSLSYLRSFPFDKIKIDQSFVRDLLEDADAGAIVRAVAGLGASLGITTTAEGVETAAQMARLKAEGCDEVQGYLVSRPQSLAKLRRMLGWDEPIARAA